MEHRCQQETPSIRVVRSFGRNQGFTNFATKRSLVPRFSPASPGESLSPESAIPATA
jgi:hypothetical protein